MVTPFTVLALILSSATTPIYWTSTESVAKYVSQNEVVLVEFWGTWCGTCRLNFDKTLEAAKKYPKAKILMVALEDNQHDIKKFIKDKKIPDNVKIALWRGRAPVKTIPRFRAYYKGKMMLETDSLEKLRKSLEGAGFP